MVAGHPRRNPAAEQPVADETELSTPAPSPLAPSDGHAYPSSPNGKGFLSPAACSGSSSSSGAAISPQSSATVNGECAYDINVRPHLPTKRQHSRAVPSPRGAGRTQGHRAQEHQSSDRTPRPRDFLHTLQIRSQNLQGTGRIDVKDTCGNAAYSEDPDFPSSVRCSKGPPLGHKLDTIVDSMRTGRIDADIYLCQETWESSDYVTTKSGVRIFHHGTPKELHVGTRGRASPYTQDNTGYRY